MVALNFRKNPPSEFGVYAASFHRAGRALVQQLAEANGYRDTDACPIIFLYRQALELYIKGTLVSGERLLMLKGEALPIDKRLLGKHCLSPLVPGMAAVCRAAGWQWATDVPNFKSESEFRCYLQALEAVDPLSFAFRYPSDSRMSPIWHITSASTCFPLPKPWTRYSISWTQVLRGSRTSGRPGRRLHTIHSSAWDTPLLRMSASASLDSMPV